MAEAARPADYERLKEDRDYWAKTCSEWADEATRRALFIHVADVLAAAIRRHGSFMDDECREALEFYDDTWAELRAAHNDGDVRT